MIESYMEEKEEDEQDSRCWCEQRSSILGNAWKVEDVEKKLYCTMWTVSVGEEEKRKRIWLNSGMHWVRMQVIDLSIGVKPSILIVPTII